MGDGFFFGLGCGVMLSMIFAGILADVTSGSGSKACRYNSGAPECVLMWVPVP